jgi:3'(2'), 5'-bisphosphate nucleotidase
MKVDTEYLLKICEGAGEEILKIYHVSEGIEIDRKADNSPLTKADKAAHDYIMKALGEKYPETPVISEEGKNIPFEERKNYGTFWLVDPLDGTKEFINRNGEFTVNIALIKDGFPVEGFIYVPVKNTWYFTEEGSAYKQEDTERIILRVNNKREGLVAVRSKSHAAPEEEEVLGRYPVTNSISVGSSLKFCMVAEGKADIYYRHGPTMEWDTGAGQAVVEAAGGKVFKGDGAGKERFNYNKESLLNGSFLCRV